MAARYEVPFALSLDRAQTGHLTGHGGNRSQLRVRLDADRIEAGWPAGNTFDNPARFSGRIESRPDGALVTGTVRESWSSMVWARIWLGPTALFLALCVGGVAECFLASVRDGLEFLLFAGVGATLFALMWRWQTALRGPTFDSDADKLVRGLTRYLTTGDGNRPTQ